jgi:hypothetical protein
MAAGAFVLSSACGDPNGAGDHGIPIVSIDAFPNRVTPGAEALVTVTVNSGCANDACTLCVGVPPLSGDGFVFIAGVAGGPQNVVGVTGPPIAAPIHVVYKAPTAEGAEVVTAWLFSGATDCVPDAGTATSPLSLTASASVRITIMKASTASDSGADSSDGASDASNKDHAVDTADGGE